MSGVNHIMAFAFVSSGKNPDACCGGSRGVRDKGTAIRSHLYYFFYMAGYPIGYLLSHADRRIYAVFTCGMRSRMDSNRAMPMIVVRTPRVTSII